MPLKAKFCQLLSKSSYKVAFLTKCYVISGFYCTFSDYLVKLSEINFIFCTWPTQEVVLHRLPAEADRLEAAVSAASRPLRRSAAGHVGHAARQPSVPGAEFVLSSSAVVKELGGRRGLSTASRYSETWIRWRRLPLSNSALCHIIRNHLYLLWYNNTLVIRQERSSEKAWIWEDLRISNALNDLWNRTIL